jgi:hypothetical protein
VQPTGGDFVKFPNIGDSVVGTITAIRKQRFEDSDGVSYAPQLDLLLADGSEVTLTAGQWKLKQLLIEQRPDVGDKIKVVHTGKDGRSKLFTLAVKRAERKPPPAVDDFDEAPPPRKAAKKVAAPAESATKASLERGSASADDGFDDDIPF